jgi:phage terminase large subunit-like protein
LTVVDLRTEFQKLRDRWQAKTGEQMPYEIARMPLDKIRTAVEMTERGDTVVVPKQSMTLNQDIDRFGEDSSLRDWDKDSEY